ncbi:protease HtpX [Candidatus Woesearchaeota archaeon]|nr:protease HtpX [Candidatus Woesearchaeota archaeon]
MRIVLFLLTNAAVLLVISIIFHWLGLSRLLYQQGMHLNSLLMMSALIGMSGSFISLLMSKWMAKQSMGVFVIGQPSDDLERWLVDTVRRQASQVGIGMPEVGIFDSPEPNAFATGMSKNSALVAVSTGLLHQMDRGEVEAVLGHEISHVANGDMVTMGLLQGVVNTFVYFFATIAGHLVDRVVFRSSDNERGGYGPAYYITEMVAQVLLSILATMIVMAFSRWREFRADQGGARLSGRSNMIAALRALQRSHEPAPLPGRLAAFGIQGGAGWMKLFMSHPPLEERIAALEE